MYVRRAVGPSSLLAAGSQHPTAGLGRVAACPELPERELGNLRAAHHGDKARKGLHLPAGSHSCRGPSVGVVGTDTSPSRCLGGCWGRGAKHQSLRGWDPLKERGRQGGMNLPEVSQ